MIKKKFQVVKGRLSTPHVASLPLKLRRELAKEFPLLRFANYELGDVMCKNGGCGSKPGGCSCKVFFNPVDILADKIGQVMRPSLQVAIAKAVGRHFE